MQLNKGRKVEIIGRKDDYQSDFYEDELRFADVVNGVLFHGKEVVKPEELKEADSVIATILEQNRSHKVICDKVRRWKGRFFSLLVLENQSYVDYRMVLRTMRAEVIGYEKQRKKAYLRAMRKGEELSDDEFLSEMLKRQRLAPVITIVLYMGKRPWDGARSLYELLEMEEELKPFISDHKLNLYDYHEYSDFSIFKTENRALFEVLSCMDDRGKMAEMLRSSQIRFSQLDQESVKAIRGITGAKFDLESIKWINEEGREVYNMCKAFEDNRLEGVQEGIQQGIQQNLKNLMKNKEIGLEEAMEWLGIPLKDKEQYRFLRQ